MRDGHAGLGGSRKAVLVCVAFHANHGTGRCSLRYATIADECGVGVRVVERAVPWLEANGYIIRGERKHRKNGTFGAYTFTLPPAAISAAGTPAISAGNLPPDWRRINQKAEPTASSSTRTTEGKQQEETEGKAS
ncbi:MAG TPA: helix-turn-helix domain-containing protein [Thermoleophilaceae bacterium]|nr:helix-turn-helix domain-containing protein [Thermoleophilaceae bacterium]